MTVMKHLVLPPWSRSINDNAMLRSKELVEMFGFESPGSIRRREGRGQFPPRYYENARVAPSGAYAGMGNQKNVTMWKMSDVRKYVANQDKLGVNRDENNN